VDLPLGRVQVKVGGGDAGHKGVGSIMECLGTEAFARLRVGVGRPGSQGDDVTDWVLTGFDTGEDEALEASLASAAQGIGEWAGGGIAKAQNRVNRRARPVNKPLCPDARSGPGPLDRKED